MGEVGGSSGSGPGAVSWTDRLRNYQIDVPASSYDLTDEGAEGGGGGEVEREGGEASGGGGGAGAAAGVAEQEALCWDGEGVEATTVIEHRRKFDARCQAYEVCVCLLVFFVWLDAC